MAVSRNDSGQSLSFASTGRRSTTKPKYIAGTHSLSVCYGLGRIASSIALSNLRAIVIVIVLAFHAVLAYLASLPPKPFAFDVAPYRWQATPIIDTARWFGFDLFCAWQDVSLMSLMFFLSGVFVPGSLKRKGGRSF